MTTKREAAYKEFKNILNQISNLQGKYKGTIIDGSRPVTVSRYDIELIDLHIKLRELNKSY